MDSVSPLEVQRHERLAAPTVLQSIRRYPLMALLVLAGCALAGVAMLLAFPPQPTGTALVVVKDPLGNTSDGSVAARYTQDQAALIGSRVVADPAAGLLNAELAPSEQMTGGQVAAATSVNASANGNSVRIGFTAASPRVAAAGASAVVQAYEEVLREQTDARTAAKVAEIDAAISQIDATLASRTPGDVAALRSERARLLGMRTDAALAPGGSHGVTAVALAAKPKTPWVRTAIRDLGVALTLGLALAGALCYLRAVRRMPMWTAVDPRAVLGAPLLAEVTLPRQRRRDRRGTSAAVSHTFAQGVDAATAFLLSRHPRAVVVAVLSAQQDQGAAEVATGLAVFAQAHERRTALVDASSASDPRSVRLLEVSTEAGGPRIWEHTEDLGSRVSKPVDLESGDPWYRLSRLIESLRQEFEFIVLLLPSATESRAAASLLAAADVTVPVVGHQTSLTQVEDLTDLIGLADATVSGYVYTRRGRRRVGDVLSVRVGQRRAVRPVTTARRVAIPVSWTSRS